jgi:hypothetical protein
VSCHVPRRLAGEGHVGNGFGGSQGKPVRPPGNHKALGILEEVPKVHHNNYTVGFEILSLIEHVSVRQAIKRGPLSVISRVMHASALVVIF